MKKIILFLSIAALISCTCLPQIPTQTIYADENCEGELPNYLQWVTVKDNCQGVIPTQQPLPGTILDAANPWVTVTIEVKDMSGNTDRERFDAVLLDTIPPELIIDTSLMTWEDRFSYLDAFQASLKGQVPDSILDSQNLIMISSPQGKHAGTWMDPDLFLAPLDSSDIETLGWEMITLKFIDPEPTPLVIDAGSSTDDWFTMAEGSAWINDIINLPVMYQSERYGVFNYRIPVGTGSFTVELHFAEIYWTDPGRRVFSVTLEGEPILTDFDITAIVGSGVSVVYNYPVLVLDGYLDIEFVASVDYAKLSGIRIQKVDKITAR